MEIKSVDNNLQKASFSFKVFNFFCTPAIFFLMCMSHLFGHTAGVYLVDKNNKENSDG